MTALAEHPAFQPLPNAFIPLPTDAECAWLAGFIDGEGTILLAVTKKRERLYPRVGVAEHDHLPTVVISDYRPNYQVTAHSYRDIELILQAVRPWLVGKAPRADLMLEFLSEFGRDKTQKRPGPGGRGPLAPAVKRRRMEFVSRMRELNRRYGPGEWARTHPEATVDRAAISSGWKQRERAEFLGDSWESTKALLRLRLDY